MKADKDTSPKCQNIVTRVIEMKVVQSCLSSTATKEVCHSHFVVVVLVVVVVVVVVVVCMSNVSSINKLLLQLLFVL